LRVFNEKVRSLLACELDGLALFSALIQFLQGRVVLMNTWMW